jgi:hypothetical protein
MSMQLMESLYDFRIPHGDHEPDRPRSADWQSAVSPVANRRHSGLPIGATKPRRFMESPDPKKLARIGTMNLLEWASSAPPRSVTAKQYDAPFRAARWKDWFWSATCALIGEPVLPLGRFVFIGFLARHGGEDK